MANELPTDLDIEAMIWRLNVHRRSWCAPEDRSHALLTDAAKMLTTLREQADRWRQVEYALQLAVSLTNPERETEPA